MFKTSYGFDVSIWEIFWPLYFGAKLVVCQPGGQRDPRYLAEMIEAHRASWIFLNPSLLQVFLDELPPGGCTSLRWVLSGGEALTPRLRDAFYAKLGARLVNGYGPTEAGTVTDMVVPPDPGSPTVPLGRPAANFRLYVLDDELAVMPIGVPGEAYLAGEIGLGQCYHARPGLTAERFIPDPYGEPGSRMYRTGDICRYRADGVLEHLGRAGTQVKLRGMRVEPAEIESVLCEHAQVEACVVLAVDDATGKRLLAFVVPAGDRPFEAHALAEHAANLLPRYMLPAAIVPIEHVPTNVNGKLDRAALLARWREFHASGVRALAPAADDADTDELIQAPRTPVECAIAEIWQDVLGVEAVSTGDDFFDLGGHSLAVVKIVSRISALFDIELRVRGFYEHPTVAALAEHVQRRRLHEQVNGARKGGDPANAPLGREARPAVLPLSYAQEGLWFLDRLELVGEAYTIPVVVRVSGALDADTLGRALSEVVRRHEALRTRFENVAGAGAQVVDPPAPVVLERLDLSALDEPARDERARDWIAERIARRFDLQRETGLRAGLLRLAPAEHVLLMAVHHIVSDGWSVGILLRELDALYAAFAAGRPSPLPELGVQYADFALWQRRVLQGEALETRLAYWRERLAGAPESLDLPTDRVRPPQPSFRGAMVSFTLAPELAARLVALARRHDMTPFMLVMAVWQTLLARWSGQSDVVVGTPVAGRGQRETQELIGYLVNPLVLRADLSSDPRFSALLARTKEAVLDAYEHADLPFDKLVAELRPTRDLSRQPLFQVGYVYQGSGRPGELSLGGLPLSAVPTVHTTAKFDLSLYVTENGGELTGGIEYATDLFERATIERLAGHLRTLLEGAVADPERRLSELPLLGPAERRRVLTEWNPGTAAFAAAGTLHERVAAQAARRPHARAVVHDGRALSYAELNARANQLAHHVRALGVGPGTLVPVCFERSLDMIVALLAVLKAGGAYVPLDPAYPPERLAHMLADVASPVLLTQAALLQGLPPHDATAVCLDRDWPEIARRPDTEPANHTQPHDVAYCIYTSGSTGKPKGVLITHHNALRLFAATGEQFAFGPGDVWSLFHSYAFDFSVWEIFGALLHGGTLVVVPLLTAKSPDAFIELIDEHGVTVLNQTPSAFRQLIAAVQAKHGPGSSGSPDSTSSPRSLSSLRQVIFGGEALDPSSLAPWIALYGDERPVLTNMYGITETTVHVTQRVVRAADTLDTANSPIGRAIADLQLYVLDAHLNPVPIGTPGELYVGGAGLARGYLNRPDLTAERFIPHPFSPAPGARLYRTGDRARYRADRDVDYLGRIDNQVKLRGYRIELGEIEACLRELDAVREAVVLVTGSRETQERLCAWLVPHAASGLDLQAVRAHLAARLPQFMVPADLVVLDALPLTANGKVDRAQLRAPAGRERALAGAPAAPLNAAEEVLGATFEAALGVPVGRDDNFFALGGDSMLAVRVAHDVARHGLAVSVADIFAHQTVAEIARAATGASGTSPAPAALGLLPELDLPGLGTEFADVYPLTTMQELMQQAYAADHHGLGVFHAQQWFRVRDPGCSAAAMERAVQILVERHPVLRTRFVTVNGRLRQAVRRDDRVPFVRHDLRALDDPAQRRFVEELLVADRADPLAVPDADVGPLRFHWCALSDDAFVLLMAIHHAVDDGWGNQYFLAWLFDLYGRIKTGEAPQVEPVPNVFKEYVALERELRGSAAAAAFWRGRHLPRTGMALPARSPGAPPNREGTTHSIGDGVVSRMYATTRRLGVSLKAIALATYFALLESEVLEREGVERAVTVATVANGRSDRLSDPLSALGLFWNLVPVCVPTRGTTREQHLGAVQRELVALEPHAVYPLTGIAAPDGIAELFFATFNFVNFHNAYRENPQAGLRIEETGGLDKFPYPFNLHVAVDRERDELFVHANYDAAYFGAARVEELLRRYAELLEERLRA